MWSDDDGFCIMGRVWGGFWTFLSGYFPPILDSLLAGAFCAILVDLYEEAWLAFSLLYMEGLMSFVEPHLNYTNPMQHSHPASFRLSSYNSWKHLGLNCITMCYPKSRLVSGCSDYKGR